MKTLVKNLIKKTCHAETILASHSVILSVAKNLKSAPSLTLPRGEGTGFTLAEVLITLGIIGVVAALTIPSLIENHNKRVVETRLKKFYSSINEAIKLSEIDNGEKETWTAADTNEFWEKYLKNYLKYKSDDRMYSGNLRLVYLPDGSAFHVNIYNNTNGGHFLFCPSAKYCEGGLDYQKYGRSQFVFGFWPNGKGGYRYHANKGVESYLVNWNGKNDSLYNHVEIGCNDKAHGFFCTAIIQRNGWKIPDNYPYKVRY